MVGVDKKNALSGKDFLTNNLILLELKKTNQPSKYANSGQSKKEVNNKNGVLFIP